VQTLLFSSPEFREKVDAFSRRGAGR
jgi:hypothetical protein